MRSLRDWGQEGKYNHVRHGFNYRMDAVQGAALGVKLPLLDGWNAERRRIANLYNGGLFGELDAARRAVRPRSRLPCLCGARRRPRRACAPGFSDAGIATNIHYPVPVHLQPAYAGLGYGAGDFPVSEALARETLSLPLYPGTAGQRTSPRSSRPR